MALAVPGRLQIIPIKGSTVDLQKPEYIKGCSRPTLQILFTHKEHSDKTMGLEDVYDPFER